MSLSLFELVNNLLNVFKSATLDLGGTHPLVVHFPIVLLLIAPVFIVAALIFSKSKKVLYIVALSVMLAGVASIFLAVETGELAAEILEAGNPAMVSALSTHYNLAEQARLIFSILCGIFLMYIIFYSKLEKRLNRKFDAILICIYLIIYGLGLLILLNAAHYGGKLVHKHAVHSTLYSTPP